MLSIGNKTFDEIKVGDIASTQRTLQAGDVRAWATAFGDVGLLAQPDHGAGTAGIVSVLLTSLVGTTLPGPGSSVHSTAVQLRARCQSTTSSPRKSLCGRSARTRSS